jgi:hypothetical protein
VLAENEWQTKLNKMLVAGLREEIADAKCLACYIALY